MSLMGKWQELHGAATEPRNFGEDLTYAIAMGYLRGCSEVHDWGCGTAYAQRYASPRQRYLGVDGTSTPWTAVVADLTQWCTPADGILVRHVLEHNTDWRSVLFNAVRSARVRLAVVLFIPLRTDARERDRTPHGSYRNLELPGAEVITMIERELRVEARFTLATESEFGSETLLLATRNSSWIPSAGGLVNDAA